MPAVIPSSEYTLTLRACCHAQAHGWLGLDEITIQTNKHWTELISPEQVRMRLSRLNISTTPDPDILEVRYRQGASRDAARQKLCHAARVFVFMSATGLCPGNSPSRAFPRIDTWTQRIPHQDHASVWRAPNSNALLIADEPYISTIGEHGQAERREWCKKHDYSMAMPSWPGMHAPDSGTRLFLLSNNTNGVPLQPIVDALNALAYPITPSDLKVIRLPIGKPRSQDAGEQLQ